MKVTTETLTELQAWAHQRAKDAHQDNAGTYRMLSPILVRIMAAEEDEAKRAATAKVIAERDEAEALAAETPPEPVVESVPVAEPVVESEPLVMEEPPVVVAEPEEVPEEPTVRKRSHHKHK